MSKKNIRLYGTRSEQEKDAENKKYQLLSCNEVYTIGKFRDDINECNLQLDPEDLVNIEFSNGLTWATKTKNLSAIVGTNNKNRSGNEFVLPSTISIADERFLGSLLSLKKFVLFGKKAGKFALSELANRAEKAVRFSKGLNGIDEKGEIVPLRLKIIDIKKPCLLLLHGTGSSTYGSFCDLIFEDYKSAQISNSWKKVYQYYEGNILCFDHNTWTESPIQNALELIKELPEHINLDLLAFSRGGLIAELLTILFEKKGNNDLQVIFDELSEAYTQQKSSSIAADVLEFCSAKREKKFTINKTIRVASPLRGTSLLSGKTESFLNITLNLLGQVPFMKTIGFEAVKEFVLAAVQENNVFDLLPGLEAQRTESPFIKIINNSKQVLNTPLLVVASDCKIGGSIGRILKVLISKSFYWDKNDLVVDTSSMFGGLFRSNAYKYYLESHKIDHFEYFALKETHDLITEQLTQKQFVEKGALKSYNTYIEDSYYRNAAFQILKNKSLFQENFGKDRPNIILLPGIMGSNLKSGDKKIWASIFSLAKGGIADLAIDKPSVNAYGIFSSSYQKFINFFGEDYHVTTFPFDWRLSIADESTRLRSKLELILDQIGDQKVFIVAHSMGGLLVRQIMMDAPQMWTKLNKRTGFKFLMFGTPWKGAVAAFKNIIGDDKKIKLIADYLDWRHNKKEIVSFVKNFKGLMELLPIDDSNKNYADENLWNSLLPAIDFASQVEDYTPVNIANFKQYQNRVIHEVLENKSISYKNVYYFGGTGKNTIVDYQLDHENGKSKIKYYATTQGDGTVSLKSGIPSPLFDNEQIYLYATAHMDLLNEQHIFEDIKRLFDTGAIKKNRGNMDYDIQKINAPEKLKKLKPVLGIPQKDEIQTLLEGFNLPENVVLPEDRLNVYVSKGDLRFAKYPVMVGHFSNDGIVSAESGLNYYLDDELSARHDKNIYPNDIGDHEIIIQNTFETPKGGLVVGLGETGMLTGQKLLITISKAIFSYCLRIKEHQKLNPDFEASYFEGVSILLIGSAYGGLSMETTINSILRAVVYANEKIKEHKDLIPIKNIEILDIYEEKADYAYFLLRKFQDDESYNLRYNIVGNKVKNIGGTRIVFQHDETQDWWQRLNIQQVEKTKSNKSPTQLRFNISSGQARSEMQQLKINVGLVQDFVKDLCKSPEWNKSIAKTLFQIMIPNDFKDAIRNQSNLLMLLDSFSAQFPWELLHDFRYSEAPLCVESGFIRQLKTYRYKKNIQRTPENKVLIIADPKLHKPEWQLPAARKEGTDIMSLFVDSEFDVNDQIFKEPKKIITALFKTDYKIIHLAGHGMIEDPETNQTGMLIGKDKFLTTTELCQTYNVPELVFVNCCHLGDMQIEYNSDRTIYEHAANIGTALIENGVKAVVVAGWAVEDNAAAHFASIFYNNMLNGDKFSKAIQKARKSTFEQYKSTNTWGAYQCYGDQFFKLNLRAVKRTKRLKKYYLPIQIIKDLKEIQSNATYADKSYMNTQKKEMRLVEERIIGSKIINQKVLEQQALSYGELREFENAINTYKKLFSYKSSKFSVSALEQYCKVKLEYVLDQIRLKKVKKKKYQQIIYAVINETKGLNKFGKSYSRDCILGDAYKYLAFGTSNKSEKTDFLDKAHKYFKRAKGNFEQSRPNYAQLNLLVIASVFYINNNKILSKDKIVKELDSLRPIFEDFGKSNPEFWTNASKSYLLLMESILSYWDDDIIDLKPYKNKIVELYNRNDNITGIYHHVYKEIFNYNFIISNIYSKSQKAKEIKNYLTEILRKLKQVM